MIERPAVAVDTDVEMEGAQTETSLPPSVITERETLRCRLQVLNYSWLTLMQQWFKLLS